MTELIYVTGNKDKFADGQNILRRYGFECRQLTAELIEKQETDGELIARDKARQAYALIKKPLFVNDTLWLIPALNDFPGAFMKYVNHCFSEDDWLRLMQGVEDRRAIMREILVYTDGTIEQVHYRDVVGEFLHEAQGEDGVTSDKVISFSGDGVSIAKHRDNGSITTASKHGMTSYDLLGSWLQSYQKD